jgi:hypothetical protein
MTFDRRIAAAMLALGLILAACGGASTASSSAAPAAATAVPATEAPTDSPEPESEAPTETEAVESEGIEPSLMPGAAADLEALLPDEAGGVTFAKQSFDGAALGAAGLGIDVGALGPILEASDKTLADVRAAVAAPVGASAAEQGAIVAIQVDGLEGDKLVDAMTGGGASSLTKKTIAGKEVLTAGAGGFNVVIYVKDDVLFEILLASDELTEAIVAALP